MMLFLQGKKRDWVRGRERTFETCKFNQHPSTLTTNKIILSRNLISLVVISVSLRFAMICVAFFAMFLLKLALFCCYCFIFCRLTIIRKAWLRKVLSTNESPWINYCFMTAEKKLLHSSHCLTSNTTTSKFWTNFWRDFNVMKREKLMNLSFILLTMAVFTLLSIYSSCLN